jgi:hypothetical protein
MTDRLPPSSGRQSKAGHHPARRQLVLVGVLASVLALIIAAFVAQALLRDEEPQPPSGLAPAVRPAGGFLDSVGVNIHVTYYDTAYRRAGEWIPLLRDLGVRHVRDGLVLDAPPLVERLGALSKAGIRVTGITGVDQPIDRQLELATGPLAPMLAAVEAPNELDISGLPSWQTRLASYLPALRKGLEQRGRTPLVGPSFVFEANIRETRRLAGNWDVTNLHPYPGGKPPEDVIADALRNVREQTPGKPVVATETGYHNAVRTTGDHPPTSEEAAGDYIPRLLLSSFAMGVQRTFLYEFLDQKPDPGRANRELNFGLLRHDLTPKPSYRALQTLLRVVRSSPGEGARLKVAVQLAPRDVRALVLERDDGSRVLALWRDASVWSVDQRKPTPVAPARVRAAFGGTARDVTVYRPSRQAEPVLRRSEAEHLDLEVGGDVVLVDFR